MAQIRVCPLCARVRNINGVGEVVATCLALAVARIWQHILEQPTKFNHGGGGCVIVARLGKASARHKEGQLQDLCLGPLASEARLMLLDQAISCVMLGCNHARLCTTPLNNISKSTPWRAQFHSRGHPSAQPALCSNISGASMAPHQYVETHCNPTIAQSSHARGGGPSESLAERKIRV